MKTFRLSLFVTFLGLSLSACSHDDEVPGCEAVTPPSGCACYEIYAPVCGCDGITYPNDCYAECHGIFDYEPGKCEE